MNAFLHMDGTNEGNDPFDFHTLQSQMSKTKATFEQMIQDRLSKVDEIRTSVELSRVSVSYQHYSKG